MVEIGSFNEPVSTATVNIPTLEDPTCEALEMATHSITLRQHEGRGLKMVYALVVSAGLFAFTVVPGQVPKSVVLAGEWEGGSPAWAQSYFAPSPGAAVAPAAGWGSWSTSQFFIPARLQISPNEAEAEGSTRQVAIKKVVTLEADDAALRDEAAELIDKAGAHPVEDIMRDEDSALEPMRFEQSGEQRAKRAQAAAVAVQEKKSKAEEEAVVKSEVKARDLAAHGFVKKDAPDGTGSQQPSAEDAAADAARGEEYEAQRFSPIRDTFAGAKGETWGGIDPVGYVPVEYLGYPMDRRAELRTAVEAAAASKGDTPSFEKEGFVPKSIERGGYIEQPADAATASVAAAIQWRQSKIAVAAAAQVSASAAREYPYHAQGFPLWERDENLGWGVEAVNYSPQERRRSSEEAEAVAADNRVYFAQE